MSRVKGLICAKVGVSVNQLRLLFGAMPLIDDTKSLQWYFGKTDGESSESSGLSLNLLLSILPEDAGIFVKTLEVRALCLS